MKSKLKLIGAVLALAMAPAGLAAAEPLPPQPKIATLDMQRLFKDYHRTEEAQRQINLERARIQQQNQERLARIRAIDTEIGNLRKLLDDPSINDSRKQQVHRDWQVKQNEGIAMDRERREFLERRQRSLNEKMMQRMKGILGEIRQLVGEEAKREDYDYVFDSSGLSTSQVPFLLYAKDAADITGVVLRKLNRDAPRESGKALTSGESPPRPRVVVPREGDGGNGTDDVLEQER